MTTSDSFGPVTPTGTDITCSAPTENKTDVGEHAGLLHEIRTDNRRLNGLLHEIRSTLDSLSLSLPPIFRMKQLIALLGELRDQLAMHFALEEAHGYFDDAINVAPELSGRAEALRAEHAAIYAEICRIADQADRLPRLLAPRHCLKRTIARTRSFCNQLQQHETSEHELILRAYNDDVGVGD